VNVFNLLLHFNRATGAGWESMNMDFL